MTPVGTRAPVAALVVYAALGIALGMVVWALALHGGGPSQGQPERGGNQVLFQKQHSATKGSTSQGDKK
jgi:hypothetical protein